ncbi:MAG: quinone oxidoreductase family protein, partial [Myxococcaceae bacterium]
MKAIRIRERGGPEALRLEEVETPSPRTGEVLVRVRAAGVNYADLMQREGTYPLPTRLPLTLGLEVAGTVGSLGPEVWGFAEGDRVLGGVGGGYAEYAVARVANVVPLPDGLDFAAATALLIQGATAHLMLAAARVGHGQSVVVHAAAGGVGVLAVQLAKLRGAGPVIATASSARKLELAASLGADLGMDYTGEA